MRIAVFLHGTIIVHGNAVGLKRKQIVKQVLAGKADHSCARHVPVGGAVEKLRTWQKQGAEILYLSPHKTAKHIAIERSVLKRLGFPEGRVLWCRNCGWSRIIEQARPDVLIEDDCESIGGESEMTYPNLKPELMAKTKSIVVKEFGGIDHLPDKLPALLKYR